MRPPLRRLLFAALLVPAISTPGTSSAETMVALDPMTRSFPPNGALAQSREPILFIGTYCDGPACPPALLVSSNTSDPQIPSTFLAVQGMRRATLSQKLGSAVARVVPEQASISVTTSTGREHELEIQYQKEFYWSLDLSAASAFYVRLGGQIDADHPITLAVKLLDRNATSGANSIASMSLRVTQPGTVTLPLTQFQQTPYFEMNSVDQIEIRTFDCVSSFPAVCPGHPVLNYTVGPITIGNGPTETVTSSWGRLKALYR